MSDYIQSRTRMLKRGLLLALMVFLTLCALTLLMAWEPTDSEILAVELLAHTTTPTAPKCGLGYFNGHRLSCSELPGRKHIYICSVTLTDSSQCAKPSLPPAGAFIARP